MKKVLIICQHFVPYTPSVGGVARVASLIKHLSRKGVKVWVITSDGQYFGYHGFDFVRDMATIEYIADPVKGKMQQQVASELSGSHGRLFKIRSRIMRLFKAILEQILVPDAGIFVVPSYMRMGCKIIDEFGVDNVFLSGPPHSVHLVGILLKKKYEDQIRLIMDYRDSWNETKIFRKWFFVSRWVGRFLESRAIYRADRITYVSPPIIEKLGRRHGSAVLEKGILVMNGFDGELGDFRLGGAPGGVIRIGYFGFIDDIQGSYRNIRTLLRALGLVGQSSSEIEIHIYGPAKLNNLDLTEYPCLKVHGFVDSFRARELMREMDFLLIFHAATSGADEVVTGKFFEYCAARRPILCVGPKCFGAARLVEDFELGVVLDIFESRSILELVGTLSAFLQHGWCPNIDLNGFRRSEQFKKIYEMLV